jgi:hypothetical protein
MTIKKKRIESLKDWISIAFFVAMCVLATCTFGSCSTAHNVEANGRTVIVTTDTTVVNHSGYIKIQK